MEDMFGSNRRGNLDGFDCLQEAEGRFSKLVLTNKPQPFTGCLAANKVFCGLAGYCRESALDSQTAQKQIPPV